MSSLFRRAVTSGAVAVLATLGVTAIAPVAGATTVAPVTGLTSPGSTSSTISLAWRNPTNSSFAGVLIRRAKGSTPPSVGAGTVVAKLGPAATKFTSVSLASHTTYSFSVWARTSSGLLSSRAAVTAHTLRWVGPQDFDVTSGYPTAVSCASSTDCTLVDNYGAAASYNGTSWASPAQVRSGSTLTDISCVAGFCGAVGRHGVVAIESSATWSSATVGSTDLAAVSCPSASYCVAVGGTDELTWSGGATTAWTRQTIDDAGHSLLDVSCPTASFCVAVDDAGRAFQATSGSWSAALDVDSSSRLSSVSCFNTTFCVAISGDGSSVKYNGTWSPAGSTPETNLSHVSCSSTTFCMAVDLFGDVVTFNGTAWDSGITQVDQSNSIDVTGLSCVSTFCAVVDDFGGYAYYFSGLDWTSDLADPVAVPAVVACAGSKFCMALDTAGRMATYTGSSLSKAAASASFLYPQAADCLSSTFCVVVDPINAHIWNGTSWMDDPLEPGFGSSTYLTGVSCASTSFCVAVDSGGRASIFDGTDWSSPASIDGSTTLLDVSCGSLKLCAAVDSGGRLLTFNGRTWSAPDYIDVGNHPNSLDCPSATFCAVVDGAGKALYLVNGKWTTPKSVGASSSLGAVSCLKSGYCYAANGMKVVGFARGVTGHSDGTGARGPITALSCAAGPTCLALDPTGAAELAH